MPIDSTGPPLASAAVVVDTLDDGPPTGCSPSGTGNQDDRPDDHSSVIVPSASAHPAPTPSRRQPRAPLVRAAAWLLTAAIGIAACSGGGGNQGDGGQGGPAARDTLPDLELTSLDGGEPLRLADLGEGAVVVNLWATWCTPCRKEMPAFGAVAEAVGDDVRIIGVNIGDDAADAQTFVDEIGVDFPQYLDRDGELHAEVGATGMPTTVFVDDGNIVDLHAGALTADELAGEIEKRFDVSLPSVDGAEGGGP